MPPRKTPSEPFRSMTHVPEARPRDPFGVFLKPAERPFSKPPLDHPSEHATCPESQPGSHLSESLLRNSFGTCPTERPLRSPLEHTTCPEAFRKPLRSLRRNPFGLTFGQCHVFPKLTPRASSRIPSVRKPRVPECLSVKPPLPDTFRARHVSRDSPRENPGYSPNAPRVPSTQAHRTLLEAPECAASPASVIHRKPPNAPRVPRVCFPGHTPVAPRVPSD